VIYRLRYDSQFEEFKYEGSGTKRILVGYKTHTGEEYPLPTFQEMCFMMGVEEGSIPEPKYIPSESPDPTPTPKISIKREKSKTFLYEGNELISKTTLKKGILTWERKGKKKNQYKNVTWVAFIEKSRNLVIVYKKGAADVIDVKNGKKKRILDKGAKKIIYSEDYGVAIKTATKKLIFETSNITEAKS